MFPDYAKINLPGPIRALHWYSLGESNLTTCAGTHCLAVWQQRGCNLREDGQARLCACVVMQELGHFPDMHTHTTLGWGMRDQLELQEVLSG